MKDMEIARRQIHTAELIEAGRKFKVGDIVKSNRRMVKLSDIEAKTRNQIFLTYWVIREALDVGHS